jgi:hypothetical protein
LLNYMHRDGWTVHCLAEDAKTSISPRLHVVTDSTLLRLLVACGATDADTEQVKVNMRRWGRGSVWIEVTDAGRKLLRLRA